MAKGRGTGVNSVDHFNGQSKTGGLCWLCRHWKLDFLLLRRFEAR
ncbi:hypothetical protein V6Z12_D07G042600 [Gossypium hirsutum]